MILGLAILMVSLAGLWLGAEIMTAADRIAAAIARQNIAIANVAKDLRELIDKITTPGGLSEEAASAIAEQLEGSATALETAAAEYKSAGEE